MNKDDKNMNIDNNDISNFPCAFPFIIIKQSSATCKDFFRKLRLVILFQAICPWNIHCVRSIRILSYSGPHFRAFELNTERYFVSLRIQSQCGKMRTRITPSKGTFHVVIVCTKCFKNQSSAKLNPLKTPEIWRPKN